MKINKLNLTSALAQLTGANSPKAALPILGNVLIQSADGCAILTATDLDLRIAVKVPVDGSDGLTEGTIPLRKLQGIAKEMPASEISIEVTCDSSVIKSGNATFKLAGRDPQEFPPDSSEKFTNTFTVAQNALRDALKSVGFAQSIDESRFVLNGVLLTNGTGKVNAVATDGRRLAATSLEIEGEVESEVILPSKLVTILSNLPDSTNSWAVQVSDKTIRLTSPEMTVTGKLITGNYPNWRQVIPKPIKPVTATIDRKPLAEAIQRSSIIGEGLNKSVALFLSAGECTISSASTNVGESSESLPAKYNGPDITLKLNPDFLLPPLKQLDTDSVMLTIEDGNSPLVMKIEGSDWMTVLMPMRVKQ